MLSCRFSKFEQLWDFRATIFAVVEGANVAWASKNSRLEKFQKIAMQHSWLAISVGSYKTHALHQTDGYTLLLRPKGSTNSQGLDEEESDLASELERNGADAVGQARLPQDHGQPDKMDVDDIQSAHDNKRDQDRSLHAGFYRYLCAEYSDTLT